MKKLYIATGNFFLIQYNIFPFLRKRTCKREKLKDLEIILLVDKTLNKLIKKNIINKKNSIPQGCLIKHIANKRVCTIHCKALPLYKFIKNKFEKHNRSSDNYIHFKTKAFANIFKKIYLCHIYKQNLWSNGAFRVVTCCGGKGFLIKKTITDGCRTDEMMSGIQLLIN